MKRFKISPATVIYMSICVLLSLFCYFNVYFTYSINPDSVNTAVKMDILVTERIDEDETKDRQAKKVISGAPVAMKDMFQRDMQGNSTRGRQNIQTSKESNDVAYPYSVIDLARSNSKRKIHTVTYASHGGRDDRFCRAVESAIRSEHDLVILGWGSPWKGLSQKLEASYFYADSLPPDDLLLFTDAFDVLLVDKPDKISEQFDKMNTTLLFSAECM